MAVAHPPPPLSHHHPLSPSPLLSSGLFYVKANERVVDLMGRLEKRLSTQKYWDQTAWNEEIFFLSHGAYKSPQVRMSAAEEGWLVGGLL